jgi:hypothetical protein
VGLLLFSASFSSSPAKAVDKGTEPRVSPSASSGSDNHAVVRGIVMDGTPRLSPENLKRLVSSCSIGTSAEDAREEYSRLLVEMHEWVPAAGAAVEARNRSTTYRAVANQRGEFEFSGLPGGDYEFEAVLRPSTGDDTRVRTEKRKVSIGNGHVIEDMSFLVRGDVVTIAGRVLDSSGRPVAGAKVSGDQVPCRNDLFRQDPVVSVSDDNGFYELRGLPPADLYRVAGYLMGGDPLEGGVSRSPFYVEVRVEARNYAQDSSTIPRVPAVSEELLLAARRLKEAMLQSPWERNATPKEQEETDRAMKFNPKDLPEVRGSVISGIDIVLKAQVVEGR